MVKKQTKKNYSLLEQPLSLAMLGLVTIGCVASIYYASVNLRFIHDIFDVAYYLRYLLLLGGGFAVGYFVTIGSKTKQHSHLFESGLYALLATTLYFLLDAVRVLLQNSFGILPFPWGRTFFLGIPLFAFIIILIIGYRQRISPKIFPIIQRFFVFSFVLAQLYYLVSSTLNYNQNSPLWVTITNYLITPLFIMIVSYLCLNRIKQPFDRLFYSAVISAFYVYLIAILWEFQTNPSLQSTDIFGGTITVIGLSLAGLTLWRARTTIK